MRFQLSKLKGLLDEAHAVLGHPLAQMIAPIILGLLPKFGQISEKDLATLKAHAEDLAAMKAEAQRRSSLDV